MNKAEKLGIAEKYLGITENYSPTHKDMSDNLRSYLTIVAYSVAIKYVWSVQHNDLIALYVFRGIALLWACWLFWFFALTLVQTFHVAVGLMMHLLDVLFSETLQRLRSENSFSKLHRSFFGFVAWFSAFTCLVFLFGTFYIIGALLKITH
jgi:hypothetical protein